MRPPPPEVEAYLARVPATHRAALEKLRRQILAAAPQATERISYQMPAFAQDGVLVWMGSFKDHCSFFPGTTGIAWAREAGLKTAKGTIQFAPEKPIPAALVKRIVKARVAENKARAAAKKAKPRKRAAR